MNRSRWLLLIVLLVSFAVTQAENAPKDKYLLYVGTYTVRGSQGIYAYRYDGGTGEVAPLGLAAETPQPSFIAIHPNHRFLYAVNEEDDAQGKITGHVSAFSIDEKTGKLTLLNQVASRGAAPCYISVDHTGKFVMVANYLGGNLAVFPILEGGRLGEASDFIQHTGSGPNPARQEAAHAHWIDVSPDERFALNADLGLDKVFVYRFDAAQGKLAPGNPQFAKLPPGAGPRHVAFHPSGRFVYVINELSSSVAAFSYQAKTGRLHQIQVVPGLPQDFKGQSTAAEIEVHPNGRFLYASNRGNDSVAVFAIDPATGRLTLVEHVPVNGKTPRNFEIDPTGTRLLVANQESDNIVIFKIDQTTGRLVPTGQEMKVAAPVCLRFLPVAER